MEKLTQIQPRYAGLAALCLLTLVYLALFRYDLYGIDEGAARGLLLNWSVGSKMLSPVAVLGFPDMRALLFVPLNFHWIGDLTAAKVLTMFLTFATALMVYRWAEQNHDDETALFATGLWLIAPLTISQVDSIGAGNYLVLSAIIIFWMEKHFRASAQTMSGYYFIILLLTALAVSMHPAGLGIAAALAWSWIRDHGGAPRKRTALLIGMACMIFFILASRMGWPNLEMINNPLPALSDMLTGPIFEKPSVGFGLLAAGLLVLSFVAGIRRSSGNLFTSMLLSGIVFGLVTPNDAWAQLGLVVILFEGIAVLVALNSRFSQTNLMARRALVGLAVVLLSTVFMLMDKQRYFFIHDGRMSASDALIAEAEKLAPSNEDQSLLIASQWPGRTMLETRRGALPLPPVKKDEDREAFMRQLHGISYIIFDHHDKHYAALVREVAQLSDRIDTVGIGPGGVILKVPAPVKHSKEANTTNKK